MGDWGNSRWRLGGAIGVPTPPTTGDQQKMLQGLGFPLRPVDGVLPEDVDDILENLPPISQGLFVTWHGAFTSGLLYPQGAMVDAGLWTMIAVNNTVEEAAPQPIGDPEWALPDAPTWTEESNLSVVESGQYFEFNTGGWISGLRVWIPELSPTTTYRIIAVDVTDPNFPLYRPIQETVFTEGAWTIIGLFNKVVQDGTKMYVYLESLNSGGTTPVTGGWNYVGSTQSGDPGVGGWTIDNQYSNLRISTTDLDTTDRGTELEGMIPGTTIQFAETVDSQYSSTYTVTGAAVDNGTYFSYPVSLTNTGPQGNPRAGNITTMIATVPVAQSTKYVREVGGVPTPSWATVTGYLAYDGVDQGATGDGFGMDLKFQPGEVSPDWDIVSYYGPTVG